MKYLNEYYILKKNYNYKTETIVLENSDFCIHNLKFTSEINNRFPEKSECISLAYQNKEIIRKIAKEKGYDCPESLNIYDSIDSEIKQNNSFIYPIYKKNNGKKSDSVIILLHGLNEKNWDKYHTWAKILLELTGKAVLLFPISFHINRVPPAWIHPRKMDNLSKERKALFQDIIESSFVNAAISTRLQFKPETFFWSGMRTYNDIIKLLSQIKSNEHPLIFKDSSIDFFSYSIGAFLTEILFMDNFKNWFSESRAFLFCGGPTMSGMYATSRYIYDSETYKSMTNFYVNNFEDEVKKSNGMNEYFKNPEPAAIDFKSMLTIDLLKKHRENKLRNLSGKIKALALIKDKVIPPASVIQTLQGKNKEIPIDVCVLDFPFEYDHISPFPLGENIQEEVDKSFNEVFKIAGEFLK
jgi:hypothetical protein